MKLGDILGTIGSIGSVFFPGSQLLSGLAIGGGLLSGSSAQKHANDASGQQAMANEIALGQLIDQMNSQRAQLPFWGSFASQGLQSALGMQGMPASAEQINMMAKQLAGVTDRELTAEEKNKYYSQAATMAALGNQMGLYNNSTPLNTSGSLLGAQLGQSPNMPWISLGGQGGSAAVGGGYQSGAGTLPAGGGYTPQPTPMPSMPSAPTGTPLTQQVPPTPAVGGLPQTPQMTNLGMQYLEKSQISPITQEQYQDQFLGSRLSDQQKSLADTLSLLQSRGTAMGRTSALGGSAAGQAAANTAANMARIRSSAPDAYNAYMQQAAQAQGAGALAAGQTGSAQQMLTALPQTTAAAQQAAQNQYARDLLAYGSIPYEQMVNNAVLQQNLSGAQYGTQQNLMGSQTIPYQLQSLVSGMQAGTAQNDLQRALAQLQYGGAPLTEQARQSALSTQLGSDLLAQMGIGSSMRLMPYQEAAQKTSLQSVGWQDQFNRLSSAMAMMAPALGLSTDQTNQLLGAAQSYGQQAAQGGRDAQEAFGGYMQGLLYASQLLKGKGQGTQQAPQQAPQQNLTPGIGYAAGSPVGYGGVQLAPTPQFTWPY